MPMGVADVPDWGQVRASDGTFELRTGEPTRILHDMTHWATERNVSLEALDVSRPSLEDVYLELTREFGGTVGSE
jgi:ABC-2 type transport system ATP-binding protein